MMSEPNFILLFVDSPAESAAFYTELLGKEPIETSPTFAMFALSSGVMLGLWSKHSAKPSPTGTPGASELAFALESQDALCALHQAWIGRGIKMIQEPTELDFGTTFVGLDPDGHRLRAFVPGVE